MDSPLAKKRSLHEVVGSVFVHGSSNSCHSNTIESIKIPKWEEEYNLRVMYKFIKRTLACDVTTAKQAITTISSYFCDPTLSVGS